MVYVASGKRKRYFKTETTVYKPTSVYRRLKSIFQNSFVFCHYPVNIFKHSAMSGVKILTLRYNNNDEKTTDLFVGKQ